MFSQQASSRVEPTSKRDTGESSRPRSIARRWSTRGSGVSSRPQFPLGQIGQFEEAGGSGGGQGYTSRDDDNSPDSVLIASLGVTLKASHAIEFITSNCKGGVGHRGGIGDFYEALASLCAAERRPNEAVVQIVNSAGANGIDLHVLKARIETNLQLQRSVKTLRLSKYLRAYPNFFRVETHGDSLNHVYPVTTPRLDAAVEAPELPLFTPGDDEVGAYRERLRLIGCGAGVLPLMSPADLVERFGVPPYIAEQLINEARVPCAPNITVPLPAAATVAAPTDALAGGGTEGELAGLERAVGQPGRRRGGSAAGWSSSGLSGVLSSPDSSCSQSGRLSSLGSSCLQNEVGFICIRGRGRNGGAPGPPASSSFADPVPGLELARPAAAGPEFNPSAGFNSPVNFSSPEEVRRLRASELALQARTSELTNLCSDLQLRVNDFEEARLCTICLEHPRDTVVLPCMHAHFCGGCLRGAGLAPAATSCPTCRGFIAGTLALRLGLVD